MPSHILPISNKKGALDHSPLYAIPTPSFSSSSSFVTATMLVKGMEQDDPSASLLLSSSSSSSLDDTINNSINTKTMMPFKPLLSRASSFTNTNANSNSHSSMGGSYFSQKRRRRSASEDSLSSSNGGSSGRRSSIGNDVRHVASETFLLTRLGLKMLRYLGYDSHVLFCMFVFCFGYNVICGTLKI